MTTSKNESRGVGRPRSSPEQKTAQLAIRLTAADRQALQQLAQDNGMPISTYILGVLRRHVAEEGS